METARDDEAADQHPVLTGADPEAVSAEVTHVDHDALEDGTDEPAADTVDETSPVAPERQLDWWHRDHPTFFALTGFFSGLVLAAVLPAIFVGILRAVWDDRVAEEAFPFVLIFLALPLSLIVFPRTRRFGGYLLFGMLVTLFVVFGVGTFVFWLMLNSST